MILTAKFTDYESKKIIGKRGGVKWGFDTVEVVDTLHPVEVTHDVTKVFYVRGKDLGKERQSLYNADGTIAKGIWQHGRYGTTMHTESIELRNGTLVTRTSYASGQIKDQHKYLKSINL
jgi:hypothetical protein